jgi:hypothetical protein
MLIQPGLSAADRISLNIRWSTLRRDTPDTGTTDALPLWKWNIVYYLTFIPYSAFSLVYIPYLTIKHLTRRDGFAEWGYGRMIRNRCKKLWDQLLAGYLPPVPKDPFVRPANTRKVYEQAEAEGDIRIEEVWLSPVGEEMRVGVAVNEHVEAIDVAAYWLIPRGCKVDRDERAGSGEKVILHIHGG